MSPTMKWNHAILVVCIWWLVMLIVFSQIHLSFVYFPWKCLFKSFAHFLKLFCVSRRILQNVLKSKLFSEISMTIIFFHFVLPTFLLYWSFLLLCRGCIVWCNPTCLNLYIEEFFCFSSDSFRISGYSVSACAGLETWIQRQRLL